MQITTFKTIKIGKNINIKIHEILTANPMDSHKTIIRRYGIILAVFILGCLCFQSYVYAGDETEKKTEEIPASKSALIVDTVKAMFSFPTSPGHWAFQAKNLYQYGRNYFNQNLNIEGEGDSKEGATEKVKEAVVKSFDESKATVVGSAKTAAKFTDDAVEKTVKKVKKTLSGKKKDENDHESEF